MKLNGKVGQVGIKAAVGDFDNLAYQKKKNHVCYNRFFTGNGQCFNLI